MLFPNLNAETSYKYTAPTPALSEVVMQVEAMDLYGDLIKALETIITPSDVRACVATWAGFEMHGEPFGSRKRSACGISPMLPAPLTEPASPPLLLFSPASLSVQVEVFVNAAGLQGSRARIYVGTRSAPFYCISSGPDAVYALC